MKITKSQLKQIIKEELKSVLSEQLPRRSAERRRQDREKFKKCLKTFNPEKEGTNFSYENIALNLKMALILNDLRTSTNSGKSLKKWKIDPLISLNPGHVEEIKERYIEMRCQDPDQSPARVRRRAGAIGGDSSFFRDQSSGLGAGVRRFHKGPLSRGSITNIFDGFGDPGGYSPLRDELNDLLEKTGAWKKMRMDDPVRKQYKNWIQTRLGRCEKGGGKTLPDGSCSKDVVH